MFLKTFAAWEDLNESANGSTTPNRVHQGNPYNNWPEDFPQVYDSSRHFIVHSMLAGEAFMNFCAALCDLVSASDVNTAGRNWNALIDLISAAIRDDFNVDFLRPAALATIRIYESQVSNVSGSTGTVVPADHFAVSITL
jgi:hypothetical protein